MEFELRFTDKEITAWGGMGLMKRMLDCIGFDSAMEVCDLPQPGSNRGYSPTQLIVQFMLSVWCGANRFEHSEVTRHDPVLQKLFGFKRMANFKAIMRFFRKFDQAITMRIFGRMYRWFFDNLQLNHLTLDLDSTVMTRYGEQEGAARGYNPRKPGRHSHHPLMAFIADARMIANLWLRPGNSHSANNALAFLDDTLDKLGDKQVALLRADSGFSDDAFLSDLDQRGIHYLVALKLNQPLQNALVDQTGWWTLDEGIEVIAFDYQAPCWDKSRRVVGIRQKIDVRPDAKGKQLTLFADDPTLTCYRFGALVTDLDLPAAELWRLYRGRADCENRIKELKYDFGGDCFNLKNFWATEAALLTVMLAYNLMSLFRQSVLRNETASDQKAVQHTLKTLRYKLFAKAGYLTKDGRKKIINLAVAMRQRIWFDGLWNKSSTFTIPVKFTPIFSP
jgi:hypothetical protein